MEGKGCEAPAATENNNGVISNQEGLSLPPRSKKSISTSTEMTAGYDPTRIPSTIFSDKPSTPTDWSAASNESLFSIYAANYSFSVIKSGELPMMNSESMADKKPAPLVETITSPPVPQVVSQQDMTKNIVNTMDVEDPKASGDVARTTDKGVCRTNDELSSCISVRSNDSHTSTRSFAFPVLGGHNGHGGAPKAGLEDKQEKLQSEADPKTIAEAPAQSWFPCLTCCKFG